MDQNQQTEEQEIDLLDLAQKLWRRRKSFYKTCGIAVVVALVVAFSIPKEYAVTVTLSPESGESSGSNLGGIASMMGVNLGSGDGADALNITLFPDILSSNPFALELYGMPVTVEDGEETTSRAVLQRQRDDMTSEVLAVDVKALMEGRIPDIPLHKNDILYIPSIHDLQDLGSVTITGEVARPDSYPYADRMTLEDLIIQAGGLREAASTVRVDVSRRIKDPESLNATDSIGQMFSFALKDGFVIDGQPGFVLQPYDQVFVRRSPGYQVQQNVRVQGEVVFGGTYSLTSRAERLSDLVKKAGGLTATAYVRGAKLTRVANDDEKRRMQSVIELMGRELGQGTLDSLGIRVQDTYTIGIDLEAALARPGSDKDLVLREGDVLQVPEYTNTVKISGAVMVPNTVSYAQGEGVKYYLSQAGGYSQHAKKSKKFIIYMNGQVAKVKGRGRGQIEPGCEIVVPNKKKRNGANLSAILGYATSFASLGTMAASITNLVK